jgi:hypothetical protein
MKLVIGKPDESELVLAEQAGGAWRPNPNLAAENGGIPLRRRPRAI